jgi:predicted RNA-binding Zn-ribbon protein involved in translation (DUF1610 family)
MRLIDVDAMMDDINNSLNEMTNIGVCVDGDWLWAKLNDAIENAPTIDPQRKTGKWIQFPNHMAYKCSECGRVIQTTDGQRNVSKHYPFCHCGAKMEAET